MLVARLKCYSNILYPVVVLICHPHADPAGFAGLAPEQPKGRLLAPGAIQDDTIVFVPPCTFGPVICCTVGEHIFESAVGF